MMIRPKGLGRGLDALLAGGNEAESTHALQTIAIDRIRAGKFQPRTKMDETALNELAESIREQGVMQPILVRPVDGGRFEIVAGERRWRAAQRAGLKEVPALVKHVLNEETLVASGVADGHGEVFTDFAIHADGFSRMVLLAGSPISAATMGASATSGGSETVSVGGAISPRRLGRLVQRLLEIDTYAFMALLGLDSARDQLRTLRQRQSDLGAILTNDGDNRNEQKVAYRRLSALSQVTAKDIAATRSEGS